MRSILACLLLHQRPAMISFTGLVNSHAGFYRSTCCDWEIQVAAGQLFPLCPTCGDATNWVISPVSILGTRQFGKLPAITPKTDP
jgi:hypothetical protein